MLINVSAAPVASPALAVRQLAGEGQALDSIFTDTDNGVGYSIEDIEDNTAKTLGGSGQPASGGSSPPPPPPPHKRQLDKISNGFAALGNAVGAGAVADPVAAVGEYLNPPSSQHVTNILR